MTATIRTINPVRASSLLIHGNRGTFTITEYANGFQLWRQVATVEETNSDPLGVAIAMGAIKRNNSGIT